MQAVEPKDPKDTKDANLKIQAIKEVLLYIFHGFEFKVGENVEDIFDMRLNTISINAIEAPNKDSTNTELYNIFRAYKTDQKGSYENLKKFEVGGFTYLISQNYIKGDTTFRDKLGLPSNSLTRDIIGLSNNIIIMKYDDKKNQSSSIPYSDRMLMYHTYAKNIKKYVGSGDRREYSIFFITEPYFTLDLSKYKLRN